MLLIRDRRDPSRLVLRANRPWHRLLAHLLAGPLDRRLAAGWTPESNVLLASRAEGLVMPSHRRALAQLLDRHLEATQRLDATARLGALTLDPDRVVSAGPALRLVVALLGRARPVSVRGVAMVSLLLTEGAGPLFNPRSDETLPDALGRAAKYLDPAVAVAPIP